MNLKSPVQRWEVPTSEGPRVYTVQRTRNGWSYRAPEGTYRMDAHWTNAFAVVATLCKMHSVPQASARRLPLDCAALWPQQWAAVTAEGPPAQRRPMIVYGEPDDVAEFIAGIMDACEGTLPGLRSLCLDSEDYASSESRDPMDCMRSMVTDLFAEAGLPKGKETVAMQPWGERPGCALRLMGRYVLNHVGKTLWALPDAWRLHGNRTHTALADLLDDCTEPGYGDPWDRFVVVVGGGRHRDPAVETYLWRNFTPVVVGPRAKTETR